MAKNKTTKKVKNQDAKIDEFVGNIVKAPKALFNFLTGDTAQVILGLVCIMFAFSMIFTLLYFLSFGFLLLQPLSIPLLHQAEMCRGNSVIVRLPEWSLRGNRGDGCTLMMTGRQSFL